MKIQLKSTGRIYIVHSVCRIPSIEENERLKNSSKMYYINPFPTFYNSKMYYCQIEKDGKPWGRIRSLHENKVTIIK